MRLKLVYGNFPRPFRDKELMSRTKNVLLVHFLKIFDKNRVLKNTSNDLLIVIEPLHLRLIFTY